MKAFPANGGTQVEVPLVIGFGNAFGAGVDLLAGSGLGYTLRMEVDVASPLGTVTILSNEKAAFLLDALRWGLSTHGSVATFLAGGRL